MYVHLLEFEGKDGSAPALVPSYCRRKSSIFICALSLLFFSLLSVLSSFLFYSFLFFFFFFLFVLIPIGARIDLGEFHDANQGVGVPSQVSLSCHVVIFVCIHTVHWHLKE